MWSVWVCCLILITSCIKEDKPVIESAKFSALSVTSSSVLVLRSEYEKTGDEIFDASLPGEGTNSYSVISGNSSNYYTIVATNGKVKIKNAIPDVLNTVRMDTLKIKAGTDTLILYIADGFDYTISTLPAGYTVMSGNNEKYINPNSEWTAINNLWGRGTAVPDVDFRIATIRKTDMPDSTIFIWDVPGPASDYGGASVWCYINTFWGNRKGVRENLTRFPFQISDADTLSLGFNFEQLYGNDEFKIAMNMFMTDESYLTNFSANDGDFFFVFDQKGNYIPPYPYSLPDTAIGGKTFARRYDIDNTTGYEWRRVIIKDGEKLLTGNLDIKKLFSGFGAAGYLDPQQYIYHIQLGIEVTKGYGAIRLNEANMHLVL